MKLKKLDKLPTTPGQYFVKWHNQNNFEVIQVILTPTRNFGGIEFDEYLSALNGKNINRFKCDWYEISEEENA